MADIFNRTAWDMLRAVERAYLEANGWFQPVPGVDEWENEDRDRFGVSFGHAVNIQKHADRIFASALYSSGRTSSTKPNVVVLPREEIDYATTEKYLEVIETTPFSPIGNLYENILDGMVENGLASRSALGTYLITDKGKEALQQIRAKKEAQSKEKP